MKVEIYGIPENIHKCYGCIQAQKLLQEHGIEYQFYPVLKEAKNDLGFEYDRPRIEDLAKRARQRSLAFQYPRIFVDGVLIGGYMQLKQLIGD